MSYVALLIIIPQVGTLTTFSPRLDHQEVSVRGRALLDRLSRLYTNFNIFQVDKTKLNLTNPPFTKNLYPLQ